jgi:hypothetical protein
MGTMLRSEIATEVFANLDNRQDVAADVMGRWINHAYHHMSHPGVHNFEDLNTTWDIVLVPGTAEYSLAEATVGYRVLAIRAATYMDAVSGSLTVNTRRQRLKPKPVQWYDNRVHPSGEPRHYTAREGQNIILSLTPDNTNTVRLRLCKEAASLDVSDATVLPEYFDEVLVTGAQAFAEFKLGMRDKASETFGLYASLLADGNDKASLEQSAWGIETPLNQVPIMGTSL